MANKRYRPKEILTKLREADIHLSQGKTVAETIRILGVSDVTYYRWRKEYGGVNTAQVKRLKELEKENQLLRKALSDLTLYKIILQEAQILIEQWRNEYNTIRPHSSLGCKPPAPEAILLYYSKKDKKEHKPTIH